MEKSQPNSIPHGAQSIMDINTVMQIVGWVGMALIVLAYYLTSDRRPDSPKAKWFHQLMNLTGALALGVSALYKGAWPNVALEIVWGGIALAALFRGF